MSKISGMDEDELKDIFNVIDTSGDGDVDTKKLLTWFKQNGIDITDQQVEDMRKKADENNDGKIDLYEFVAGAEAGHFDL